MEAEIQTEQGIWARASVPSGASTGTREAQELRDGKEDRFLGRGVLKAVENVNQSLGQALRGREVEDQGAIDRQMIELDGTENKKHLGANAMLAVSLCVARAAASEQGVELFRYLREHLDCPTRQGEMVLPAPMMNIINGGRHAANNLDIQEFMVVPHLERSLRENLRAAVEVYHHLHQILSEKNYSTNGGDEGGFAPDLESHEQAVELILEAIERAHYRPGEDISLALDCAASEFYREGVYTLQGHSLNSQDMIAYLESFIDRYPIYSVEDGLAENDHMGWKDMTARLGERALLVGDDLFVTNPTIFQEGIRQGEANGILVKLNQIGTLTETLRAMELAFKHGYEAIVSHRSGETGDHFIADLAVATACGHIKAGSAARSDRTEKYNQLLRIEDQWEGPYSPHYYRVKT